MILKFLRECFERDRKVFRNIHRRIIYPLYRYEYFRFTEIREKMNTFKYLSKEDMLKGGEWKWVYVIKESKK